MNLEINNTTCEDIIFNGHYLEKLYFGNDLVWEKQHSNPYESMYLTLEALDTGTIGMDGNGRSFSFDVSVDGGQTWTTKTLNSSSDAVGVSVNSGDKVMFRHNGNWSSGATKEWQGSASDFWYNNNIHFSATCPYKVYGNIMSMWWGDNFVGKTTFQDYGSSSSTATWTYKMLGLFAEKTQTFVTVSQNPNNMIRPPWPLPTPGYNSSDREYHCLVDAENLVIPLDGKEQVGYSQNKHMTYTYFCMFYNCICLQKAPKWFNPTYVGEHDFDYTFANCWSMGSAPIDFDCYMDFLTGECFFKTFENCFWLVDGPKIFRPWYNMNTMYGGTASHKECGSANILTKGSYTGSLNTFLNCQSLVETPTIYITGYLSGGSDPSTNGKYILSFYDSDLSEYHGVFGNCMSLEKINLLELRGTSAGSTNAILFSFTNDGSYTITPVVSDTRASNMIILPTGWTYNQIPEP